ncbi:MULTISPECIES: hypothetical protein [unclassified Rickettsia]
MTIFLDCHVGTTSLLAMTGNFDPRNNADCFSQKQLAACLD